MLSAGPIPDGPSTIGDSFITGVGGVAALDTPQLKQTKLEIRNIVAQIAELAAGDDSLPQFLDGALPRICQAMGASAAALWSVDHQARVRLVGQFNLPDELQLKEGSDQSPTAGTPLVRQALPDDNAVGASDPSTTAQPSVAHLRILHCVAHEGEPMFIPPGTVRVAADRPVNPISDSLLVVPITVVDRVDMMLEVVQPPGGGPAAARGYLRFVAQMADVVGDFLRRHRLRELSRGQQFIDRLQLHLVTVAGAASQAMRLRYVATALAELMDSDLVLVAVRRSGWMRGWRTRWQVAAVSHLDAFDARSDTLQSAERWLTHLERADVGSRPPSRIETQYHPLPSASKDAAANSPTGSAKDSAALQQLANHLDCAALLSLALANDGSMQAVVAVDAASDEQALVSRGAQLSSTFASLVSNNPRSRPAGLATVGKRAASRRWMQAERIVVRISTVLLVLAIALFPVPDQVGSLAVLESTDKELFYAPVSGTVTKVMVDTDQRVLAGQLLLELEDPQLDARLEELEGQRINTAIQLEQDRAALLRGQPTTGNSSDDIEGRIEQLKISLRSLDELLAIAQQQREQLRIFARRDAIVTTWNARNRLQGRPVPQGGLLLTTRAPDTQWQLKLSIAETHAGRVKSAMEKSKGGLPVQFSLSSHPGEIRTGYLVNLSPQLIKNEQGQSQVVGDCVVDAKSLPAQTDGAVARAAIDCGRTVAVWLVVRDAWHEVATWWQLNM